VDATRPGGGAFASWSRLFPGVNRPEDRAVSGSLLPFLLERGMPVGATLATDAVPINNGLSTVNLDFSGGMYRVTREWVDKAEADFHVAVGEWGGRKHGSLDAVCLVRHTFGLSV
jgi:hypothetical protein